MSFVDGESLARRMQHESPLPIEETAGLVAEVALARAAAIRRAERRCACRGLTANAFLC